MWFLVLEDGDDHVVSIRFLFSFFFLFFFASSPLIRILSILGVGLEISDVP